jgi:hypothetical protein
MKEEKKLVWIFTGTEISVILLKGELEENGITALIQNDYQSGIFAGFSGGVPSAIDLYVQESDLFQAEPIVNDFIQNTNE